MSFDINYYDWALTISIVSLIISLLAILKNFIKNLIFYPHLKLQIERAEHPVDTTPGASLSEKAKWHFYRVIVSNQNTWKSVQSKNTYGRILSIKKDGIKLDKFNPMQMRWVSNSMNQTLSIGEHMMLNLCTVVYNYDASGKIKNYHIYPGHFEGLNNALAAGFDVNQLKDGKYEYEIGIYGQNYKGSQYLFTIDFKGNNGDPQVNISCTLSKKIQNKEEYGIFITED